MAKLFGLHSEAPARYCGHTVFDRAHNSRGGVERACGRPAVVSYGEQMVGYVYWSAYCEEHRPEVRRFRPKPTGKASGAEEPARK